MSSAWARSRVSDERWPRRRTLAAAGSRVKQRVYNDRQQWPFIVPRLTTAAAIRDYDFPAVTYDFTEEKELHRLVLRAFMSCTGGTPSQPGSR